MCIRDRYAGDHVTADLTGPWQSARWRTVAIVRELAHETAVQASPEFKRDIRQLLQVEALIQYGQRLAQQAETRARLAELKNERQDIKARLLAYFNPHFGSCFRTSSHRTPYFSAVGRYADVYCSALSNFAHYALDHTFYAQRVYFPHEVSSGTPDLRYARSLLLLHCSPRHGV